MNILQDVFDFSARAVNKLDERSRKNDQKSTEHLLNGEKGDIFVNTSEFFASLPPAMGSLVEEFMKVPFIVARDAANRLSKKTGRPLDTSLCKELKQGAPGRLPIKPKF